MLNALLSPDQRWIAAGCQDATVHIWDTIAGEDMAMRGFPTKVRALGWSKRGPCLATAGGSQLSLWNFAGSGPAGKRGEPLRGHQGKVTALAWIPKGDWLLSTSDDGELFAWHHRDGEGPEPLEDVPLALEGLSVSPDGAHVVLATEKGGLLGLSLDVLS